MRYSLLLLLLPVCLLLASCLNQSGIQSRYAREHEQCKDIAESNIDRYVPKNHAISEEDRNAELVTLFSDCMGKKGWQVAKPKRADGSTSATDADGNPTTGNSIPPSPSPAAKPAQTPAEAAAQNPVHTEPAQLSPGLRQPAAPSEGASTYQPSYGSGPGRNF